MKNDHFFGENGFGDVDVWKPHYPHDVNAIIQKKNAIEIIRELVMANPHRISLFCIGPLTNIALAIKIYPEIQANINEIILMGGSFTGSKAEKIVLRIKCLWICAFVGMGNVVPTAEFNFYMDSEAVSIILNSLIRPIMIFPLDAYDPQLSTVRKTSE